MTSDLGSAHPLVTGRQNRGELKDCHAEARQTKCKRKTQGLMRRLQWSKLTYKIVPAIVRQKPSESSVILFSFVFIPVIHILNHRHCCFIGPEVLWLALLKRLGSRLRGGYVPPVVISTRVSLWEPLSSLFSPVAVRGAESVAQPSDNTQGRPNFGAPVETALLCLTIHYWGSLNLLSTSFGASLYIILLLSITCKKCEGCKVTTSLPYYNGLM